VAVIRPFKRYRRIPGICVWALDQRCFKMYRQRESCREKCPNDWEKSFFLVYFKDVLSSVQFLQIHILGRPASMIRNQFIVMQEQSKTSEFYCFTPEKLSAFSWHQK
jgi:hypothetical protein